MMTTSRIRFRDLMKLRKGDLVAFLEAAEAYLQQDAPDSLRRYVAQEGINALKEALPDAITLGRREALMSMLSTVVDSGGRVVRKSELTAQTHPWQIRRSEKPPIDRAKRFDSIPNYTGHLPGPDKVDVYVIPATLAPRNTTRYRCLNLKEIVPASHTIAFVERHQFDDLLAKRIDPTKSIFIIQRLPFNSKTERIFNTLRTLGATIAYDIDDPIFDSDGMEEWRRQELQTPVSSYEKAIRHCDMVLTTTSTLRRRLDEKFGIPVHVVPNLLSGDVMRASKEALVFRKRDGGSPGTFCIGITAGSKTHDRDVRIVLEAVEVFMRRHPRAMLKTVGHVRLPDKLKTRMRGRIQQIGAVPPEELQRVMATFDVHLIPLEDSAFNQCKSNIKYLETSAVKVPVIASCVGQQGESILHMQTGYLCDNSTAEWLTALEWMSANRALAREMGEHAYEFVSTYCTTASAFQRKVLQSVFQDLRSGVCSSKISFVVVAYNPIEDVQRLLDSIRSNVSVPYEVLIFCNRSEENYRARLEKIAKDHDYFFASYGHNVGKAIAANYLFRLCRNEFVCGVDDDYIIPEFWDLKMVRSAQVTERLGWLSTNLTADSSGLRGLGKARRCQGWDICLPSGVGGWNVFTRYDSREYIGFYMEHGLYGGIDGNYNRRARELGLMTGYVRVAVGQHKLSRHDVLAWELHKQRIQDKMRRHGKQSDDVKEKFVDYFSQDEAGKLSCNIHVSTSVHHDENVWGDTHYARSLGEALERQGMSTKVIKREEWSDAPATDIAICLFGLHKYVPREEALNILWIISHVDKLDRDFLLRYDYLLCASQEVKDLCSKLAPEIKAEVCLQATDPSRFEFGPSAVKKYPYSFVGNSRRVYRSSVKYAVELGLDLHLWGTKWEQFIPKRYIKGQSLSNEQVAEVYRSSVVVFNDHWEDQIEFGLVNNRIYDIISTGSIFVSDYNPGIASVCKGLELLCYRNKEQFEQLVLGIQDNSSKYLAIINDARSVICSEFSFDRRAERIVDIVKELVSTYVDYKSQYLYEIRHGLGMTVE